MVRAMRNLAIRLLLALALFAPAAALAQTCPPVAALPDTARSVSYSPSSSTGPFSVTFAILGDSTDYGNWLEVWLNGVKLTPVTQWTFSLSSGGSVSTACRPITNGQVTLITASTGTLEIVGARRPRRLSQFSENAGVAARDINRTVTDLVAENRETWDLRTRQLLTKPGDTIGNLPSAATRAGGVLTFDGSGNPTISSPLTGLGNVIGPISSVVGHIPCFNNTTGTLLADCGLVGSGDMVGPASSVDNHVPLFSGTGGKTLKDSGLTLTPSTGTITLDNAKTFTISNTLTLTGTDGSSVAFGTGGTVAYTANNLSVFASTTSAQLAGVISNETGSGVLVFNDSPTLITPALGVASATSINKVAFTAPATSATLTIADGKTLTANSSLTLAGTDGKTLTVSNSGTIAGGDSFTLAIAASKTLTASNSLTLAGTDGKTLTVSNSGTLGGGDGFTLAIAASKTLTVSNSLTFTGTDSTSFAFPGSNDTVVGLAASQTLTNKTLTSPTINGGAATALTALGIRSTGSGAFDLTLANTENLTAGRTLTLTVNNAARTINISGNLTLAAGFTTAGGSAITLTSTGTTNVTLPTSGTLATRDTSNTFSSSNTFSALTQFTDITLSSGKIYPTGDSTTAVQLCASNGTTCIVRLDTSNSRVGINKTPGAFDLDVNGAVNVGGTLTFGTLSATSLGASTSTITGLTINNTPNGSNDYLLYYSAADGAIRRCTVSACAAAATAGVSSLNGLTGGLTILPGDGIGVSAGGSNITVSAAVKSAFSVHKNGTDQTGVADSTSTLVTWPTEVYDVGSNFASNAWTPPAGKVAVVAGLVTSGTITGGAVVACSLYKNGVILKNSTNGSATNQGSCFIAAEDIANGTDAYTVQVFQDVSAGTATVVGLSYQSFYMGHWIGP